MRERTCDLCGGTIPLHILSLSFPGHNFRFVLDFLENERTLVGACEGCLLKMETLDDKLIDLYEEVFPES